jgi:hypothetical protein
MTRGEKVIRPDFAKDDNVKEMKRSFVILYDKMEKVMKDNYSVGPMEDQNFEAARCATKAQEFLEVAAMYAVKALTA